jgi:hypothetical protein
MQPRDYNEELLHFEQIAEELGKMQNRGLDLDTGNDSESHTNRIRAWNEQLDTMVNEQFGEYDLIKLHKTFVKDLDANTPPLNGLRARIDAIGEMRKDIRANKIGLRVAHQIAIDRPKPQVIGEYEIRSPYDIHTLSGEKIQLQPQLARLLYEFLIADGHTLGKWDIMRAVWDSDASEYREDLVSRKISDLNNALKPTHNRRNMIDRTGEAYILRLS